MTDQYNNITKYIKLGNTKVGVLKGRKQKTMPQSLSKVYVYITFSNKNRQNLINDN